MIAGVGVNPVKSFMHKLCTHTPTTKDVLDVVERASSPPPDVGVSLGRALGPRDIVSYLLCKTPLSGDGVTGVLGKV